MADKKKAPSKASGPKPRGPSRKPSQPAGDVQPETKQFPIVGVGASAGGLEAFTQLLEALPTDTGMAFVLVQHLSPDHDSILTEILGRATALPVREVNDGMPVQPDRIYVIPPNVEMVIRAGVLHLIARPPARGPHMPIDLFLHSLAADRGHGAIAVILSGTASDGAEGIRGIKAAGGIVFAQQPESARYDGMPRSAAATGCVDFILPPKLIAEEIARIARHPYLSSVTAEKPTETASPSAADLERIFLLLRGGTGNDFSLYRRSTILRRIERRMLLHRAEGVDEYLKRLETEPQEVQDLSQDILINVTSFFRDAEAFRTLASTVFPRILASSAPGSSVRFWVPGCATGEEPYSLIMSFLEFLAATGETRSLQVFATDIDETALETARAGSYPDRIATDVPPEHLRRFFVKAGSGWQIGKSIRELCLFARQNVAKDPPFSRIDLVSCRNLLIYMEPALQKKVLPFLHYALKPEGFLMLGASETVGEFETFFTVLDRKHKIYAKKASSVKTRLDPASDRPVPALRSARDMGGGPPGGADLYREADRAVLSRYFPAGVIVNDRMDILQFRGSTSDYLEPAPGEASLNLLKMAREGLLLELRAAVSKARKTEGPVRRNGIRIRHGGRFRPLDLEVVPFRAATGAELHFAVLFQDSAAHAEKEGKSGESRLKNDLEAERLREELAEAHRAMRNVTAEHEAATEELRAVNEELQSSNEELQSVNEEMETAQEELQSTNEELTSVNDELQNRNGELSRLNDDLGNVLGGIEIPVIILGEELRIRRLNPTAVKLLGPASTAAVHSLADIGAVLRTEDLEGLVREVIDSLSVREREVQDGGGHWYSLRVRPYRTAANRIEGAILTLIDIDHLKQYQDRLMEARDYAQSVVDTVHEPILILDGRLRVVSANQSFYATFGVAPDRTERRPFRELGDGTWNAAGLPELLESVARQDAVVADFPLDRDFPSIGRRVFLLNARRLLRKAEEEHLILLAMEDVTVRRTAEAEREKILGDLTAAVAHVKRLSGLLPICASCKKIRDDKGYWSQLEIYIRDHSEAEFSHGLCPECARALYPECMEDNKKDGQG